MIQSDVVVTSDGRTVTVGEWLAENVARRKAAEARVAELEAELAKTDAMLREYMVLGTVENFATLKAENARLRLFAGAAPQKEGQ
jgi:hypothetical protein